MKNRDEKNTNMSTDNTLHVDFVKDIGQLLLNLLSMVLLFVEEQTSVVQFTMDAVT